MSPIGTNHIACVKRLNALLSRYLGQTAIVSVQNPIRLSKYAEPEPDVSVPRPRDDFYAGAHPGPEDVLLIIEVADTTLPYDRGVKMPLYAGAGIAEFWVVDLPGQAIEAYTRPSGGKYKASSVARRGESLAVESMVGLVVNVDDVLGQAQ